ncbi:hypothetical protein PRK78_002494 [Emydomyces testavorans]|uniref:Uncharacterized protein n=1 Tax=Emydomyces testavorans TaxID=2070801 RepID=A0AAF0DFV1_9EURO|nr:hypothetical protein PRK78_002494 [Emydomyces testavorans]
MALALRLPRSYDFDVYGKAVKVPLPYNIISSYLPGILAYLDRPGPSHRPLKVDLTPVIAQAQLLRSRTLPRRLYARCIYDLFRELDELQTYPLADPRIMKRLITDPKPTYRNDLLPLLTKFACYHDLLDRHCFHAPRELRDDLSTSILELIPLIARYAPLAVALNFIDLLHHAHFPVGMELLIDHLPRRRWRELLRSRGHIDLALSGRPSERIMAYVMRHQQQLEQPEDLLPPPPPFALPFELDHFAGRRRRHFPHPYDSEDGIEYDPIRRGDRRGWRHGYREMPAIRHIEGV